MRKVVRRALFVVLAGVVFVAWNDLARLSSGTVEFVVPDGTSGLFILRERPDGVAWRRDGNVQSVDVPASGIVVVDTLRPVDRWHFTRARFAGGAPIAYEIAQDGRKLPEDGIVRLYGLWSDDRGDSYYFVGTRNVLRGVPFGHQVVPGLRAR